MPVSAVSELERFFRAVGRVDVDKDDLKRFDDLVPRKVADLLLFAQITAKQNGRGPVEPQDLPITKGLQECIHRFDRMDEAENDGELAGVLADLVRRRPQEIVCTDETEARLPHVAGGVAVAFAQTFRVIDSDVENPSTQHWERATRIFDLLL